MGGNEQFWWHVARSSGLVAWALAAMSVLWGLALSTRALGKKPKAPWLLDLHRFLGGLTIVFVAVHLVGLWADSYVEFDLAGLFVPLATPWKTGAVAWGIVAFYLLLAVEITSLLMKRIPKNLWKAVHFSSYALYAMATAHLLMAGTDASETWIVGLVWASVGATAFFTIYRFIGPGKRGSVTTTAA